MFPNSASLGLICYSVSCFVTVDPQFSQSFGALSLRSSNSTSFLGLRSSPRSPSLNSRESSASNLQFRFHSHPSNPTNLFMLQYLHDVLCHLGDGDTQYYSQKRFTGPHNDATDAIDSALESCVKRQIQLEEELAYYKRLALDAGLIPGASEAQGAAAPYLPHENNTGSIKRNHDYIPSQPPNNVNYSLPLDTFKPPVLNMSHPQHTEMPNAQFSTSNHSNDVVTPASTSEEEPPVCPSSMLKEIPTPRPHPHFNVTSAPEATIWSAVPVSPPETPQDLCVDCVAQCTRVVTAILHGDFSQRISCPHASDSALALQTAMNAMADHLSELTSKMRHVLQNVVLEGKLGEQIEVDYCSGRWKDIVDAVNSYSVHHMEQVRDITQVSMAVAHGDLSKKVTVDAKGQTLVLKNTINTMVDQLNSFASEVTRLAHEVGTEGKLGSQAIVPGVAGTWKLLTDNVNTMAANLTVQVRDISTVCKSVASGDLSKKIAIEASGEILDLKETINTMVDQLRTFAVEVTRVSLEVGTEGRLGGQAVVRDMGGTWKDLTDNVNIMAHNLTNQVRDIATVCKAVAQGDLSQKVTVIVDGEMLELKEAINTMVQQLRIFAGEVTRVAREVGTEGKLGGQAVVKDVGGTWKDLTDNVNMMAANLTNQVRSIAEVTKAVAQGDLSKQVDVEVSGEILELKETINTMVDKLRIFAGEVTRVAREVGTDGKLGGQAVVEDVAGTWKDLTDNVNIMAANLTGQVRSIAEVTKAVASGDLSKKISIEAKGEILDLKDTINTMVEQLRTFATEVTRVALDVGTEGKLGGQAVVKDVAGTWKDLTNNVNMMAANLTDQVRSIAAVTKAVASGDLSKKINIEAKGEIHDLSKTVNSMVDKLRTFAAEVTRVAKEVGTDGKLGGQAVVEDVAGTWKDLTDNVNIMADNLTNQVRSIAEVTKAVAMGDLSKKINVELRTFAMEVTRVALEVGTEGKLGGQAVVKDVAGTWKDLTNNVNTMAANLTGQVRSIAEVTKAVASGDLSKKIAIEAKGEIHDLSKTVNSMVDKLRTFAAEVTRVAKEVGTDGKLGGQAVVDDVAGTWKDLTDNVNIMADNLTNQVRSIAEVTKAVAMGDLSKKISVEVRGEIAELKETINTMVDQLRTFAMEVTRVALEVGTEGKLGGQAVVKDVAGTWKDLTNNVNIMAANLTGQQEDQYRGSR
ncbi:uncharacterized protein VTP21DRAFT_3798 [Calcarisporiella thermophila]|uniref:uncharacterized protein n=1 Tax=Calcarisporiella thermophila TaxID=911321 RepID=UPI0037440D0F